MRYFVVGLVVLALVLSGLLGLYFSGGLDENRSGPVTSLRVGQEAPNFELRDRSGKIYALDSLRGQVVLVNFWATWCPPCRAEMPSMEKFYKMYNDRGVELLAVNVEPEGPEIMEEFEKDYPHSFPVVFDLEARVQNLYGVFKFPETFIIDKNGIIVEKVIGSIDWTDPEVLSYFEQLLKE